MRARRLGAALALTLASGCAGDRACETQQLVRVATPRLAILTTDYASSAIVLVDDADRVIGPWIDSGTRPPVLVAALSGDVALPRVMPSRDALVVLDRYQTDVLTAVPFERPEELWQTDLRGGRTSGASPNPQDVVALADGRWLVSRFNPAEDPGAPALARGNDLALLAPATHELLGRVELGADTTIDGVTYHARPTGLAALADGGEARVLVGLGRLSSFVLRRTGPGAVALFDPASGTTQVLELEGLANCGMVASMPGEVTRALVLCRGAAFGEDETLSGIVELSLAAGVLAAGRAFLASADPSMPPPGAGLVPLDARRVAYVAEGSLLEARPDRLVVLDLESGESRVLIDDAGAFTLGQGARDGALLLVPDAERRALRRFDAESLEERAPLALDGPCLPLPPREVVVLR